MKTLIKHCLQLAKKGIGRVNPNPLVGCVIVKDNKIVGSGFHEYYGGTHAEVNAVRTAGKNTRGATLYVNLEPCNHYGKTDPCTETIIQAGIRKVVFGMYDPNPFVKGGGCAYLKSRGIEIEGPVLETECAHLNDVYIKNVTTKLPFVALKAAQTLDGFISPCSGESQWITSDTSRKYVHKLRHRFDAVLVGANTIRSDNPTLLPSGTYSGKYRRLILTDSWNLPPESIVFSDEFKSGTTIISSRQAIGRRKVQVEVFRQKNISILPMNSKSDQMISFLSVLRALFKMEIYSVLIEGGARVFSQAINEKIVDKLYLFTAPKLIGQGVPVFAQLPARELNRSINWNISNIKKIENDIFVEYYPDQC